MKTNAWNPELYLRFERERSWPPRDLAARVELSDPSAILDLGCGPGNSTVPLWTKWPRSRILGLDQSSEMIETARLSYPDQTWKVGDIRDLDPSENYDLLFACSSLQWIPHHSRLLPNLLKHVNPAGALAAQLPQYHRMEISGLVDESFREVAGLEAAAFAAGQFTFHSPEFYDQELKPMVERLDLWETSYIHHMADHQSIVEMVRSTGLRPYLERLPDPAARTDFEGRLLRKVQRAYPARRDGGVLFPFLRFFFVAYTAG